jgi:hypothetical protein
MAISWESTKQPLTADSTGASEMIAAHKAVRANLLVHQTMRWITGGQDGPMELRVDNSAVVRNFVRGTSKSLGWLSLALKLRIGLLRDLRELGILRVAYVKSKDNRADIFTKALARVEFERAREMLGVAKVASV